MMRPDAMLATQEILHERAGMIEESGWVHGRAGQPNRWRGMHLVKAAGPISCLSCYPQTIMRSALPLVHACSLG